MQVWAVIPTYLVFSILQAFLQQILFLQDNTSAKGSAQFVVRSNHTIYWKDLLRRKMFWQTDNLTHLLSVGCLRFRTVENFKTVCV